MSNNNFNNSLFDQSIDNLQNRWLYKINQLQSVDQIKDFRYSQYKNQSGATNYAQALSLILGESQRADEMFQCDEIEFQINYQTKFGQHVAMIGSIEELGSWDAQRRSVKLNWTKDNIWRVRFKREELPPVFEFKFVIKDDQNIVAWERDPNHKFDLPQYIKSFSQPDAVEALREGGLANGVANLTFVDSEDMISYIKKEKVLQCLSPWRPQ